MENKNILDLKDKATGWLSAKITKDQTTESVAKVLIDHFNLFGRVHKVVTDGGPPFRDSFTEFLRGYDVLNRHTSAYRHSSNGLVE